MYLPNSLFSWFYFANDSCYSTSLFSRSLVTVQTRRLNKKRHHTEKKNCCLADIKFFYFHRICLFLKENTTTLTRVKSLFLFDIGQKKIYTINKRRLTLTDQIHLRESRIDSICISVEHLFD
jgi:hypothetical protein